MPPDSKAQAIASKFVKYINERNVSHIEAISEEEVAHTLIQYSRDKDFPHYSAMALRLQELKDRKREILSKEEREKERKQGYKDGLKIGIISTIIGGLFLAIILKLFKLG